MKKPGDTEAQTPGDTEAQAPCDTEAQTPGDTEAQTPGVTEAQTAGGTGGQAAFDMTGRDRLTRLADFLFEVGMLRKTPRTGYQFLGSGAENVAEHSFRTAVIGYVLAGMRGADPLRTMALCLFHDLHEARTGDFNYVNKLYNTSDEKRALTDALTGTGLREGILDTWDELESRATPESVLAHDADQLDLIVNLKEELDLGNRYAAKWLDCSLERLKTDEARALAKSVMETDHTDWWFQGPDRMWWTKKNGKE